MGAPEAVIGEDAVGVADEIPIGEEQELDEVVGRLLGEETGACRRMVDAQRLGHGFGSAI